MSLYYKLKAIHPSLKDSDFTGPIALYNENGVTRIGKWEHPTLAQPTQAAIDAAVAPTEEAVAAASTIAALEREHALPRVIREFMLGFMEANATPAQLAKNPGYVKVKALDERIKELRNA